MCSAAGTAGSTVFPGDLGSPHQVTEQNPGVRAFLASGPYPNSHMREVQEELDVGGGLLDVKTSTSTPRRIKSSLYQGTEAFEKSAVK